MIPLSTYCRKRGPANALSLLLAAAAPLAAQHDMPSQPGWVLLFEQRFDAANPTSVRVTLERHVAYRVELAGAGMPVFEPAGTRPRPAYLVEVRPARDDGFRHFEVYPVQPGPHLVSVEDLPPGATATLWLYEDAAQSRRLVERRDRGMAMGLLVGAGAHTGYRLDPSVTAIPAMGPDAEACLLLEAGSRFGTCLGGGWQSLPDAGFAVTWVFIEARLRVLVVHAMRDRRTDLGATLRFSQGLDAGPRRSFDPDQLSVGLFITQHLARGNRRRGWSIVGSGQCGRIGNSPAGSGVTVRLMVGMSWVP